MENITNFMADGDMPIPAYLPQDTKIWFPILYPAYLGKVDVNDEKNYKHAIIEYVRNQLSLVERFKKEETKRAIAVTLYCAFIDFGLRFLSRSPGFKDTLLTKLREFCHIQEFQFIENELKRLGYALLEKENSAVTIGDVNEDTDEDPVE